MVSVFVHFFRGARAQSRMDRKLNEAYVLMVARMITIEKPRHNNSQPVNCLPAIDFCVIALLHIKLRGSKYA